ncbi:peptide ABC transporter permease [Bosea sp. Root670]|uniref:ABC transporter permease n=1 Tax=Bosea sp. Root670 TaxID=1736583 RepID=UPI00071569A3|nr:ABC transporter permease [Bosea sp. Root670]KRE07200.1 peptide ABC transporter permease [Bosea sp. Root670]
MTGFLLRRIALMIPTLLGVAVLIFLMLRVLPGDIVEAKLRGDGAAVSAELIATERARLGLDRSLPIQFVEWVSRAARGDLGVSMWTGQPVTSEIGLRIGLSLQVAVMAALIATLIALPLGTLSAIYPGTPLDYCIRLVAASGMAVPSFWFGMMLILMLLYLFNWAPPITYTPFWQDPLANLNQLIWPALAVGYRYAAVAARMVRSSLLEVLQEDYIRTARAKGTPERDLIWRHAIRNGLLPTITIVGLEFAFLVGGLVVTEQVFNLNGIGKLLVQSVAHYDYVMIQGIVMVLALVFVLTNLVLDILYVWLDPRIEWSR